MKKLLLIVWSFASVVAFGQSNDVFEKGKEFYKAGNYERAVDAWQTILEQDQHSVALYYNLANAYYKLNQVGPSIYYYEKALELDPEDLDVKNNIAFAQNMRVDVIEPLPKTVFAKWYAQVSGLFSYDGWAISAVVFMFLMVLAFLIYYFADRSLRKRFYFLGMLACLGLLLFALTMAYSTYSDSQSKQFAIVFDESVNVLSEPTKTGEFSFQLHEGTKVGLRDTDGDWVLIRLIDGKEGWVPKTAVKAL